MRRLVLPIAAGLASIHAVSCPAQDTAAVAGRTASLAVRDLQVVPADLSMSGTKRWILWQKGFGDGQSVHLALCDAKARCRWERAWPDAYDPVIRYMGSWSTEDAVVFLLLYSQGAEAQTAIVIGLGKAGRPAILDRFDAAAIGYSARTDRLEVDTQSGLPVRWECQRWDRTRMRLRQARCR